MIRLISFLVLIFITGTPLNAQNVQASIDSLKRERAIEKQHYERRNQQVDSIIHVIQSSTATDAERNELFAPIIQGTKYTTFDEYVTDYKVLRQKDEQFADSIYLQKLEVLHLLQALENEKLSEDDLRKLREENIRLKSIMRNYTEQITALESGNVPAIDSADVFYYNLKGHKKPLIYYFNCPQDPSGAEYWKVSSNPRKKTLLTEVYTTSFQLVERYEQQFDSIGAHLISYAEIDGDSLVTMKIVQDDMYRWKSNGGYVIKLRFPTPTWIDGFQKTMSFLRKDTLMVLGKPTPVLVFYSEYEYTQSTIADFIEFSYYAEGIGFVKQERSFPQEDGSYLFLNLELEAIFTEKEWTKQRMSMSLIKD